ncbi:DUF4129 domain-containing protein [Paenibacillus chartarius]|uniref:DUF4129 domain-containing protein n=1 Tax=Paenibacillus chartarius TaxID=747481 RepID=A0ABV6DVP0_9BACL
MQHPHEQAEAGVLHGALKGWRDAIIEQLLFVPVWLAAGLYMLPDERWRALWLFTLPLLALCGTGIAYGTKRRWLRLVAALPPAAAHAAVFGGGKPAWMVALLALAACVAVLRGAAVTGAAARAAVVQRYTIGIACYGIGSIVASRLPEWIPYVPLLTAMGVFSLAVLLFTLNRRMLQREIFSSERGAVTASTRRHNRLFVTVTLAAALAVTILAAGAMGNWVWSMVRSVLQWLFSSHSEPPPPLPDEPKPPAAAPTLPAGERGWLSDVLDVLLYGIGAILLIAAVWFALRETYRRRQAIIRAMLRIVARLASYFGRMNAIDRDTGYVDEETDLPPAERLDSGSPGKGWLGRLFKRRAGRERWGDQADNRARIRYLYRQWLRAWTERGGTIPPNLTPEELRRHANDAETAELIRVYYKARYSDSEITGDDLEAAASTRSPGG